MFSARPSTIHSVDGEVCVDGVQQQAPNRMKEDFRANQPSQASEANCTNSEADAVKIFAFGKVAASRAGVRDV